MTDTEPVETRSFELFVVSLCVYETVAVVTGRCPTVSTLCRRHWPLEAALLALLLGHLHIERKLDAARADHTARFWHGRSLRSDSH